MDVKRIWQLGAAVVALGILALGWFLGVNPQLDAAAQAAGQTSSLAMTNDQTQITIGGFATQQKKLPQLEAQLSSLLRSVPDAELIPSFITELNEAATGASVRITGIDVSDPQQYQPATAPSTSSTTSTSSTATPTPAPTTAATPAPAATATPAATPQAGMPPVTSPLITAQTMAVIPVAVTVSGSYADTLAFVGAVQKGTRLFLVTKLTTSQDSSAAASNGDVTVTVSGYIYSLTAPQH